jgi:hypothetical protein
MLLLLVVVVVVVEAVLLGAVDASVTRIILRRLRRRLFWYFSPVAILPSFLTKPSVAAASSNDKGESLPVLVWAAAVPVEVFPVNNCLVVVPAVFLLLSFFGAGGGGDSVLLTMGRFRWELPSWLWNQQLLVSL